MGDSSGRPPRLDVVVVSYRCRAAVLRCLDALASKETIDGLGAVSVHVVDNGSGDGTVEAIRREHPAARVTALPENRGFAAAANVGFRAARGELVLLLNPDVRLTPSALASLVRHLAEHPEVGVVGPRLLQPDGRTQGACGMSPSRLGLVLRTFGVAGVCFRHGPFRGDERLPYFVFPDAPKAVDLLVGAVWLMRREVLEQIGELDERYFLYGEDLDWCRRARAAGVTIVHHPGIEAAHEQGASASRAPLTSLEHFHRSSVRYHVAHEASELPAWFRPLARASLLARYGIARVRHAIGVRGAHRAYLTLDPREANEPTSRMMLA